MVSCTPACVMSAEEGERRQQEQRIAGGLQVVRVDVPIRLPHSGTNRHRPQSRSLPGSHTKSPKHTRARVCRWSDRLLSAREPTIGAWRCTRTGTSGRCSSATASISARREATASISCRSGRIGPTPSVSMYLHCEASYCCNALHAFRRSCVATTVLHCVATCRRGDRTHTARRRTHRSSQSSASPPAGRAPGTHSHADPHRSRR